jgi:SdpC family antimicrobial peptide
MRHRLRTALTVSTVTAMLLATVGTPGHAGPALGSTGDGAAPAQATTPPAAAAFDGSEIFTGLLLGHGPAAERFPELVIGRIAAEDATPADVAEAVTQITDGVAEIDPSFFGTFRVEVTSGDRVRVDRALRSGQEVLAAVLTEHLGGSRSATDDQRGTCFFILVVAVLVAVVTVATVADVGAAVHIQVTVSVTVTWDPFKPAPPDRQLDYERWVDAAAEALAV